jgi:myo-inositol 2-dehydrogenase/D-chiro-inositol 1-dehydrogenase
MAALINLGVIGCGKAFTDLHAAALQRVVGAKVVAIADPVETRRAIATRLVPAAGVFSDWRELLDGAPVDAVLISTPPADHAEPAREAFARKKHVYLEKPLAVDLSQAASILSAWRAAGTRGMVGFNYRFHPLYIRARNLVMAGKLGKILGVRSTFMSSASWLHDWKRTRSTGGGALLDLANHHIDLVQFIADRTVVEISAHVQSEFTEQDTAWVSAVLENDIVMQSFFCLHGTDTNRFEIYGTAANLRIDHYGPIVEVRPCSARGGVDLGRAIRRGWSKFERVISRGRDPSYEAALSRFVSAIANEGETLAPDLDDGMQVLRVIDAAEASVAAGKACRIMPFSVPMS